MTHKCNHYYVEKFAHGKHQDRWFECVICNSLVMKGHNKLMNSQDEAPTKAWGAIFKELNK